MNNVSKIIKKSTTTVARAINSLKDKKLINIYTSNNVAIYNDIANPKYTANNAKFLIIELNPKVTSKEITI